MLKRLFSLAFVIFLFSPIAAFAIGGPFGGPMLSPPTPCIDPPGSYMFTLGPPSAGVYKYIPGVSVTYLFGPPKTVGQLLLGNFMPGICTKPGTPPVPVPVFVITAEGSSGPAKPVTPPKPAPARTECVDGAFNLSSSAGKAQGEANIRQIFSESGIPVNKGACGLNKTFQSTAGGCTDVSGLQCQAVSYLQSLQTLCGKNSLLITGGSEAGHGSHIVGNKVDLSSGGASFNNQLSQCIKSNFTFDPSRGVWVDRKTGSTFLAEGAGQTRNTTGVHWHVCIGRGC